MARNVSMCLTDICTEIWLNILGYSFCTKHHILAQFCQLLLPQKRQKLLAQKMLCFGTKNFGEIDPGIYDKRTF